jgi:hypothetical protein
MTIASFGFLGPDILRAVSTNHDVDGWREVTTNWIVASVVVSVACVGIMTLLKWIMKVRAGSPKERIWRRGKALGFIFAGMAPVLVFLSIVWFLNRDFMNVIEIAGLLKGVLIGWVLYLALFFLVHLGSWRYDLK